MARYVEREDVAKIVEGLVLDPGDTAVTVDVAAALFARGDVPGMRVLARAVANAEPEYLENVFHGSMMDYLLPPGHPDVFDVTRLTSLRRLGAELVHDGDPEVVRGARVILEHTAGMA